MGQILSSPSTFLQAAPSERGDVGVDVSVSVSVSVSASVSVTDTRHTPPKASVSL